ncbi:MAG: UbiD family decarboxylase [Candidatus Binatia bacterium]|nr:UbiD family decarboxylase [Candidatus Binatia bacterium]
MASDLRTYLSNLNGELLRIEREVDPLTELGALCSESDRPLLFLKVKGYPGWQICDILAKTRTCQAVALGTTPERVLSELGARLAKGPCPWKVVDDGPVREIIWRGSEAELLSLPIAVHTEGDPGPYIGGGMAVTKDPDTGIQNVAFLRVQCLNGRRAPFSMAPRHNYEHYRKYEARREAMPMAMVIGHHPAYEIAANYSGRYGVDEFELVGSLLGETVEMVKCVSIDLHVPAHAEIVIEGLVPPHIREDEGPFGEFQGYQSDGARKKEVWEITAITMRRGAIYRHLQSTVFTDHQRLVARPMEAGLFERVRDVGGRVEVHNVNVPPWAGNFMVIIQLTPQFGGQVKDALMAALSSSYIHPKIAIAVDADVDPFNAQEVFWAVSTRVNPAKDTFIIDGTQGHRLDLSLPVVEVPGKAFRRMGSKMGIDATKPSLFEPEKREEFARARPVGTGQVRLTDFLPQELAAQLKLRA